MKDPEIEVAKTKKNATASEHRVAFVTIDPLASVNSLRHSWGRLPRVMPKRYCSTGRWLNEE